MNYFSRYGGKENKVAKRHEKSYIRSLFKGAIKEPFERKPDKDVRRYEAAEFRFANTREQRAYDRYIAKQEKRDLKLYDKERF